MTDSDLLDGPWLMLDAAGPHVQAALFIDGRQTQFLVGQAEALTDVFSLTETILQKAALAITDIRGWLFGMGPGSTLGIRVAAMAILTWQSRRDEPLPIKGFQGLSVVARLLAKHKNLEALTLYAPWKTNHYHKVTLTGHEVRLTTAEKSVVDETEGNVFFIPVGRIPKNHRDVHPSVPYSLLEWQEISQETNLMNLPKPEMYLAEEPEFARWTPQRHSRP